MLSPVSQYSSHNTPTLAVWSNQPDNSSFKAFLSTLTLCNVPWHVETRHDQAKIWCVLDLEDDEDELANLYLNLFDKPKVVYLATQFKVAPIAEWVFFKVPINLQALTNWLTQHQFLHHGQPATHYSTQHRWLTEPFKLQFWPNVSNYTDSPEIVQICSILMRDWTNYATIATNHLPKTALQQLLADAEAEGNLIYQPAHQRPTVAQTPTHADGKHAKAEQKDNAWGFFKGLFSRFVK